MSPERQAGRLAYAGRLSMSQRVLAAPGVVSLRHLVRRRSTMGRMPDDDFSELLETCTQFVSWHGPIRADRLLATVPPDTVVDRYGEGGVVADLERETAGLLGKPAAVFLPSGTMAQQAVLRVHADRLGRRTIVFHPACHVDQHEGRAYERLHHLVGRPAGEANRQLTRQDLDAVAEPAGVLLLELPQR